jgi:ABC-type Fe3+ transport system permease subunit
MNEIYWITRLDGINTVAMVIVIITVIISIISLVGYFVSLGNISYYKERVKKGFKGLEDDVEEWINYAKVWKKIWVIFVPILIVSTLVKVFVPTTNEAFVIYGVGGTIDYIKSNPTAKQLPDKCVKALDRWVDSWGVEKPDSIEH